MNNKTANYGNKHLARQLRREMTAAETVLWKYLRGNATGYRFRRQQPIGHYVMDFYCYELNLCIELDGGVHDEAMADIKDEVRTEYLNSQGITVLRYSNDVVFNHPEAILKSIQGFGDNPVLMEGWHKDELIGYDDNDEGYDPL